MRTLRLHGPGQMEIHDEAVPTPGSGEQLIRVTAVGICGSDLLWHTTQGIGDARLDSPLVLGHEFAGVIESGLDRGLRVAVDPAVPCDACRLCRAGHPNMCENILFAGHGTVDGALREYIAWPKKCLFPLPDSMSDTEGAMLEPLGVAIHALDLGRVKPGAAVGVFGCGPIGLLIIQLAKAAGALRIIATDKLEHRLELASKLGATTVIQAEGGREAADVLKAASGIGVDTAFEAAGSNEAVETAVHAARPGGVVVLAGIPPDDRTGFTASTARRKGLTIMMVRRMKHTYPRAIALVEATLVDLASIISHCFPLEEFEAAFAAAGNRTGHKVMIEPHSIAGQGQGGRA